MHLHPDVLPTLCEILDLPRRECHLSRVATWADQNRMRMRWSASLHYVGALDDNPPESCAYPGNDGWAGTEHINVLDGVKNTTALLQGWVRDEVNHHTANEALKFLIHFVGDMHQPLHLTGKLRGGNGAKVLFDRRHTSKSQFSSTLECAKRQRGVFLSYDTMQTTSYAQRLVFIGPAHRDSLHFLCMTH